jgi:hypothetical protein
MSRSAGSSSHHDEGRLRGSIWQPSSSGPRSPCRVRVAVAGAVGDGVVVTVGVGVRVEVGMEVSIAVSVGVGLAVAVGVASEANRTGPNEVSAERFPASSNVTSPK